MSRPKVLSVFDRETKDIAYSKLANIVSVVKDGSSLRLKCNTIKGDTALITFKAPCECSEVRSIIVGDRSLKLKDATENLVEDLDNLFSKGASVSVLLDIPNDSAYILNAATNQYIEDTFLKKEDADYKFALKRPEYVVWSSNKLKYTIENVERGSIIRLKSGSYPLLTLTGEFGKSNKWEDGSPLFPPDGRIVATYPEDLTIIGEDGATIAGISITSGVRDIDVTQANSDTESNADISNAILPKGLTIKNLTFTDSFCLRNACVDNMVIDNCTFKEGAYVHINPNSITDGITNMYGKDQEEHLVAFDIRPHYAVLRPKNIVVRDCIFEGANRITQTNSGDAAIRILGVEDIVVYRNTINGASYNGINIGGTVDPSRGWNIRSRGKIAVTNNIINNTVSTAIRMYSLQDAEITLHSNDLNNVNDGAVSYGFIKIENECLDISYDIPSEGCYANTYGDSPIYVDGGGIIVVPEYSGVVASGTTEYSEEGPDSDSFIQGAWNYTKYSDGSAECFGDFTLAGKCIPVIDLIKQSTIAKCKFTVATPFPIVTHKTFVNVVVPLLEDVEILQDESTSIVVYFDIQASDYSQVWTSKVTVSISVSGTWR